MVPQHRDRGRPRCQAPGDVHSAFVGVDDVDAARLEETHALGDAAQQLAGRQQRRRCCLKGQPAGNEHVAYRAALAVNDDERPELRAVKARDQHRRRNMAAANQPAGKRKDDGPGPWGGLVFSAAAVFAADDQDATCPACS